MPGRDLPGTFVPLPLPLSAPLHLECDACEMAPDWRARGQRLKAFVVDNFLPIAFTVAIVWALAWPAPGEAVIKVTVRLKGELRA